MCTITPKTPNIIGKLRISIYTPRPAHSRHFEQIVEDRFVSNLACPEAMKRTHPEEEALFNAELLA